MINWMNWSLDTVEGFLTMIHDHLPNPEFWFPWVLGTLSLAVLAGPGVAAFLGAWRWGAKAGLAGLAAAYFGGLWFMVSALAGMTRCGPQEHCSQVPDVSTREAVFDFIRWVADAYAASWFLHLLWIAFGVGCLYGGLAVRRRRLRKRAAASAQPA